MEFGTVHFEPNNNALGYLEYIYIYIYISVADEVVAISTRPLTMDFQESIHLSETMLTSQGDLIKQFKIIKQYSSRH